MKVLKIILSYLYSTTLAFVLAFAYMRIVLGPEPKSSSGMGKILEVIYQLAFVRVGLIVGIIIAFFYTIIDFIYLNKKLKNNAKFTLIRMLSLLLIAIIVCATHYLLEKVFNIL